MQISKQIDQLIESLKSLKPLLTEDTSSAKERFNNILEASIESSTPINSKISEPALNVANDIPNWVDREYSYQISKPRKPKSSLFSIFNSSRKFSFGIIGCHSGTLPRQAITTELKKASSLSIK